MGFLESVRMKTFTMYRRNVPDATHNENQKNAPEGLAWQCDHCGHVRRLSDYY